MLTRLRWTPPPSLVAPLPRPSRKATEEDCGSTFDLDEIRKGLKGAPAGAALGADQWRPHEWRNLPDEGLAELRQVLTGVERCVAWPRQVLHNVAVFIGKPTE